MKDLILNKFNNFVTENGLNIRLSFEMQKGYETAFGNFDVTKLMIYFNLKKESSFTRKLFTLYHELRHAEQYLKVTNFPSEIQESINYVIQYNGMAYKLKDNEWKECRLTFTGIDFTDVYFSLPYELDANKFAYDMVKEMEGIDNVELEKIYISTLPKYRVEENILKEIFRDIDTTINRRKNE